MMRTMSRLHAARARLQALWRDERGTEIVEFLVLTATVVLTTYVLLITLGKELAAMFNRLITQFFR
jgi:Flp pilus assembly pilin Flp